MVHKVFHVLALALIIGVIMAKAEPGKGVIMANAEPGKGRIIQADEEAHHLSRREASGRPPHRSGHKRSDPVSSHCCLHPSPLPAAAYSTNCSCCASVLDLAMARVGQIRSRPFSAEELEVFVDGVLHQYERLYGEPGQVVKLHQRKAVWRAIACDVRAVGVCNRRHTHCHKRWDDISRLSKNVAEMTLGLVPRSGRLARHTMTPLMRRIIAVTHPDLSALLRGELQQTSALDEGTGRQMTEESGGNASGSEITQTQNETEESSPGEGDRTIPEDSHVETPSDSSSDSGVKDHPHS